MYTVYIYIYMYIYIYIVISCDITFDINFEVGILKISVLSCCIPEQYIGAFKLGINVDASA